MNRLPGLFMTLQILFHLLRYFYLAPSLFKNVLGDNLLHNFEQFREFENLFNKEGQRITSTYREQQKLNGRIVESSRDINNKKVKSAKDKGNFIRRCVEVIETYLDLFCQVIYSKNS